MENNSERPDIFLNELKKTFYLSTSDVSINQMPVVFLYAIYSKLNRTTSQGVVNKELISDLFAQFRKFCLIHPGWIKNRARSCQTLILPANNTLCSENSTDDIELNEATNSPRSFPQNGSRIQNLALKLYNHSSFRNWRSMDDNANKNDCLSAKLFAAIDKLIIEYEEMATDRLNGLSKEVSTLDSIKPKFLDPNQPLDVDFSAHQKHIFARILHHLFPSPQTISWGRIVAMLAFTAELALKELHRCDQVNIRATQTLLNYVEWGTCESMSLGVTSWIEERPRGWNDLVEFSSRGMDWVKDLSSVLSTALMLSVTGSVVYAGVKILSHIL